MECSLIKEGAKQEIVFLSQRGILDKEQVIYVLCKAFISFKHLKIKRCTSKYHVTFGNLVTIPVYSLRDKILLCLV